MSDALFALVHRPGPAWVDETGYREQPGIERHIGYLRRLFDEGRMVMGGPFLDDAGGLALIEADDMEEASTFAYDDPTVREGLLSVEVHPWRVVFRREIPKDVVSASASASSAPSATAPSSPPER
jgi:uncharacterized protein YciI